MRNAERPISVGPNTVVFKEGDPASGAYLIEHGSVEVSVTRNGEKVVLGQRGAGEVFGEMSIIDDRPRTATITTLEPCLLVRITPDQIHNRIGQADPILRMYLGVVLERFRETLKGLQSIDPESLATPSAISAEDRAIDPIVYSAALSEIKLEQALSEALRESHFELHFQPIIELPGKKLVGFESLIRWSHKERGLLLPARFLPTAEASGLIVPIGLWVLRRSCEFLKRVHAMFPVGKGGERLFVSINLSARSFNDPRLLESIGSVIGETGISPHDVKLEITETTLFAEPSMVLDTMRRLKDMGFSIAIDDFGTGYSSLSYLHKYPFDTLKIDRSFVQNVHNNPKNDDVLASIAALANHLDLAVVAEGIETKEQEQQAFALNCGLAQGYFYARPAPEADILRLLNRLRLDAKNGVRRIGGFRLECA
jgi:EAL domain-containing protein (putative c-di-GMP-specific phosphodiesterase class I)/CRP-like cAMP-binding protein